ncbi:MAG: hypothetical protein N2167_00020 [Flavobacteriales bacterium]|nr:hypothetical protein [Flavobacteriales bacterium]
MAKILGLDLGTNSIGWAIRETDEENRIEFLSQFKRNHDDLRNQIVDYGVIVFEKGVGDGKSGEFSLAAERRKNRSKRRLYNAKRYRKWELLKILIKEKMCPLNEKELRLWSIGEWVDVNGKKKNKGRKYPLNNEAWLKWLAMDPEYFGIKGMSTNKRNEPKPIRKSPYDLKCELLNTFIEDEINRKLMIGRALYHLAQRRGFKSSRKSGKSTYAENKEIEEKKKQYPNYHIATLANETLKTRRFRASGVIQRKYYEEEFLAICKKQGLSDELTKKLHHAAYYVRPLRSQKGLVGNCTLEKGKTRIPISHPLFEEFRALAFINNIQRREAGSHNRFEPIPIDIKKKIFEQLFFKKTERGQNNGKVDERSFFKFDEIIETFSENGKWEFNYKNKPNVSACPVIAGLMNVFDNQWKNKFITDENRFGINWEGLKVEYTVKYGTRKAVWKKGKHEFKSKKIHDKRTLNFEGIWHLLYDYLEIKDKPEELVTFCKNVLEWDDDKAKQFSEIGISQGYGSLSRSAISKILPYLQEGYLYSEAVSFANLSRVLGKENFEKNKNEIQKAISETIRSIDHQKEKLNIVNGLIQKYFAETNSNKKKGVDEQIRKLAEKETEQKLRQYFGESNWTNKPEEEKNEYYNFVLEKYLTFLYGKQQPEEKASSRQGKNPEIDYYKLPRLDEAIKKVLHERFGAEANKLKHLYHPSDIDIYPKANKIKKVVDKQTGEVIREVMQLGDPMPPSKGWKNPMAMRTMYELRKLINYLLEVGKIDPETKIVIEMARELNDANKRWAIQEYQKRREEENKEFAKAILGVAKQKYPNLNENDADNIDKFRLWWEQLENGEEVYKQIKSLKEDVDKYRLWKEQQCQCMYTGKTIRITDLFDGTKTQFAHTFQRSDSFDNSLANLTVADAYFNTNIQKDRIPTQLENYKTEFIFNGVTYPAIEPRLKKWIEKRDSLKERIEKNKAETKKANRMGNVERKNYLVRERHLLQFDFDYWDKKVKTFTLNEIPNWWKNSQLVDTQIINKYARAYMKSLFNKVEVQKATVVNEFKKIFEIKGDEQKDRSRHSHHAIDAAVLTLIPGSGKRDELLKEYYRALESNINFHDKPYPEFNTNHILEIDTNVLINHIMRDKTLTPTRKIIRKRGVKQLTKNGNIKKMEGDSIRGQLHLETYFGAVKVPERNKEGYPIKENGKFKTLENELWIVSRKPIDKVDLEKDVIVDELLKKHIQDQIKSGKKLTEVVDFQGKRIRHIRCRVKAGRGFLTINKAVSLKLNSHNPKKEHKKNVFVQNDENFLYLLYENVHENKIKREARIISLLEFAKFGYSSVKEVWNNSYLNKSVSGLPLKHVIRVGQKAIFYKENKEELKKLTTQQLQNRVFVVYKFNVSGTPDIYLKNNLDARPNPEIDKLCENDFNPDKYQAGLSLKAAKLNCLFEGKDFEIKSDGEIVWKF